MIILENLNKILINGEKINDLYLNDKYYSFFIKNYSILSFEENYKQTVFLYLNDNLDDKNIKELLLSNLKIGENINLEDAILKEINGGNIFHLDKIFLYIDIKNRFGYFTIKEDKKDTKIKTNKYLISGIIIGIFIIIIGTIFSFKNTNTPEIKKEEIKNNKQNIFSIKSETSNKLTNKGNKSLDVKIISKEKESGYLMNDEEKNKEKNKLLDLKNQNLYIFDKTTDKLGYFISDTSTYNLSLNVSLDYVSNPDYIVRTKSYKLILPYGYKFVTSKGLNYSVKYNYGYFEYNGKLNSNGVMLYGISKITEDDYKKDTKLYKQVLVYGSNNVFYAYNSNHEVGYENLSEKLKSIIDTKLIENGGDKLKTLIDFYTFIKNKRYNPYQKKEDLSPDFIDFLYSSDGLYCESANDLFRVIASYLGFQNEKITGFLGSENKNGVGVVGGVGHQWTEVKIFGKVYFFDATSSNGNDSGIDFGYNNGNQKDFYVNTDEVSKVDLLGDIKSRVKEVFKNNIYDKNFAEYINDYLVNNLEQKQDLDKTYEYIVKNGIEDNFYNSGYLNNDVNFIKKYIDKTRIPQPENITINQLSLDDNINYKAIFDNGNDYFLKYLNGDIPNGLINTILNDGWKYHYENNRIIIRSILIVSFILLSLFVILVGKFFNINFLKSAFYVPSSIILILMIGIGLGNIYNFSNDTTLMIFILVIFISFLIINLVLFYTILENIFKAKRYGLFVFNIIFLLSLIWIIYCIFTGIITTNFKDYFDNLVNSTYGALGFYNYFGNKFFTYVSGLKYYLIFILFLLFIIYFILLKLDSIALNKYFSSKIDKLMYDIKKSLNIDINDEIIHINKFYNYFIFLFLPKYKIKGFTLFDFIKKIQYLKKLNKFGTNLKDYYDINISSISKNILKNFKIKYKTTYKEQIINTGISRKVISLLKSNSKNNTIFKGGKEISGFEVLNNSNFINKIDIKKSIKKGIDIVKIYNTNEEDISTDVLINPYMIYTDLFIEQFSLLPDAIKINKVYIIDNNGGIILHKKLYGKKKDLFKILDFFIKDVKIDFINIKTNGNDIDYNDVKYKNFVNKLYLTQLGLKNNNALKNKNKLKNLYFIGII
ncbi:MAG: transglutaminase domain-containing protein [Candidatus Gracilibacteria bacterium]|nr:transglutaminase domain-containing protein [Candidatus Gracilibacteria bacterium]